MEIAFGFKNQRQRSHFEAQPVKNWN